MDDERRRRLDDFDRTHGLVNGKPQRPVTPMVVAEGVVVAVVVLAVVVAIVTGATLMPCFA